MAPTKPAASAAASASAPSGTSKAGAYNGPDEKILELRKPLKLHPDDENPVSQLLLTEPTAGQLSKFMKAQAKPGADDVEAGMVLISANTGVSVDHLKNLVTRDFEEALAFLTGFMDAGPKTGET